MSNPKILNLDDFETEIDKTVVIDGVTYQFKPFSVGDFIKNLKEIEAYAKADEIPVSDYLEHMIGMVRRAFPDIPEDVLQNLSMLKLRRINEFIRGQTEQEAVDGVEQAGGEVAKN